MSPLPILSPSQRKTADAIKAALEMSAVVNIAAFPRSGLGVTTILKTLEIEHGGRRLDFLDFAAVTAAGHPKAYETALFGLIERTLAVHDVIYLDRLGIWTTPEYERTGLNHILNRARIIAAEQRGKRLVLVDAYDDVPQIVMADFEPADYAHILQQVLPDASFEAVDFTLLKVVAGNLNASQLTRLGGVLSRGAAAAAPGTADLIAGLTSVISSNVYLDHVEEVALSDLRGAEHLVERLERSVLLPYREPALARELGLEPKHGVLLHGPPGMGKTTIGRALAHAMKGKFFILDGDYNHEGQGCFFKKVRGLFQAARAAAPSVIFIDDADIILSDPGMQHWGRFLLTMLDGLSSDMSSEVCVMMTAMDLRSMPAALLRSGRLEVWLELKPPAAGARKAILKNRLETLPFNAGEFDLTPIVGGSDGFSPADLRKMVSDAAGFLAVDRLSGAPERSMADYLQLSIDAIRSQQALAKSLADANHA